MDNHIDISEMKRMFYQHFPDYCDYLANMNLDPSRLSNTRNRVLADFDKRSKTVSGKGIYLERNGETIFPFIKELRYREEEAVSSVEKFFKLIAIQDDVATHVSKILGFIQTPSGNGSLEEMNSLHEDQILRCICKYFWERKGNNVAYNNRKGGEQYQLGKIDEYDYEDIDFIIEEMIEEEFHRPKDKNIPWPPERNFPNLLHVCRKIRNTTIHSLRKYLGFKEARAVHLFILFTYVASVLILERTMKGNKKSDLPQVRLYVVGTSRNVRLFEGKQEIKSQTDKSNHLYFIISWYKRYTIRSVNQRKEFQTDWTYTGPTAMIDADIMITPNDSNTDSEVHKATFHQILESVNVSLLSLDEIKDEAKGISEKLDNLEIIIERIQDLSSFKEIFEKYTKQTAQLISVQNGQMGELVDLLNAQREEQSAFLDSIVQLFYEVTESDKNARLVEVLKLYIQEKERERARRETSFKVSLYSLLLLSIVVFLWHCINDNSILWLTNKLVYYGLGLLFVLLPLVLSYLLIQSKEQRASISLKRLMQDKWQWFIGLIPILIIGLIAGSFFMIPMKTEKSFVKKYDFTRHTVQENAKAASFLESMLARDASDEGTLMQLVTYFLKYGDDVQKARQFAEPMRDVNIYPKGCVVAAEALLATHQDYTELKDLIAEYWERYGRLHPTLGRILGIQKLFGLGMDQDHREALEHLVSASKAGDIPSFYYIGYALSHDMTEWHNGELDPVVEVSQYDISHAVHYYKQASEKGEPRASLELGKIYADFNLCDSAIVYYQRTIDQCQEIPGIRNNLRILFAAKFQLGLVLDSQGKKNYYVSQAKQAGYEPAILYSAIKENDHKTAIERYKKAGKYAGYRYIPPVTFEYIAIGDSVSALEALQTTRPDGHFDMAFVSAMQRIVGSPFVQKDSIWANQLMKQSAINGCKFAELFCLFREIEQMNRVDIKAEIAKYDELEALSENIHFGYALTAWLMQKNGWPLAVFDAEHAVSLGHPAGALVLSGINYSSILKGYNCYPYYQMAVRMSSNKKPGENAITENVNPAPLNSVYIECDTVMGFKKSAILLSMDGFRMLENKKGGINAFEYCFWKDVLIANHCFDDLVYMSVDFGKVYGVDYYKQTLEAAVESATPCCNKNNLVNVSTMVNLCDKGFIEIIKRKYREDDFRYIMLVSEEYNKSRDWYGSKAPIDVITETLYCRINNITDECLISEFSNLTDDFYEFRVKEEELMYGL